MRAFGDDSKWRVVAVPDTRALRVVPYYALQAYHDNHLPKVYQIKWDPLS
jgi:hypothetical protein